jgi:pSer/pThr/pTyr-binding forkhead associated (FHA) protein
LQPPAHELYREPHRRDAPIEAPRTNLKLLVAEGETEREFLIDKPSVVLGRALSNEIVLVDGRASRTHARFDWDGAVCSVNDLGSSNGTLVNGVRVEKAALSPGDIVTIGDTRVRLEVEQPEAQLEALADEAPADIMQTVVAQRTIVMAVNNTSVPRLAIQALGQTWEVELRDDSVSIGRAPTNDVVIDSEAVSREHARVQRRRDGFYLVDHNSTNGSFFHGDRVTEQRLDDGDAFQIGPAQIVFKDAFVAADLQNTRVGMAAGLPTVIFIPGIMGSELWAGNDLIWPNFKTFLTKGTAMKYPSPVEPRALVNEIVVVPGLFKADVYRRVGDYLVEGLGYERGRDLFEFPYDWRQDNRISARRLAEAIEKWDITGPIVIVAHSMGCLISRYYIENLGGKRRISRLIQIGGPHRGSPRSIDILMTGRGITPMGFAADDLRRTVATFPSMYQLLPTTDCVFDDTGASINVLEDHSWVDEEFQPHLVTARDFHRELPLRSSVSTVSIFGYGLKTTTEVRLQRTRSGGWQRLSVGREASGDTVVPESSSVLQNTEIHPVRQPHGTLFLDNDVKMRLKLELTRPHF